MPKIRTIFMGTPEFSVPSLEFLIQSDTFEVVLCVTQPDKRVGRKQILTSSPVKQTAIANGIAVLQPEKINDLTIIEQLQAYQADLIVTAAYGQILSQGILDLPKFGCVNVHASLLPKYRGAAPINFALINGEAQTGITLMKMDKGMDTGDIIAQAVFSLEDDLDAGHLNKILSVLGATLLEEKLELYLNGKIELRKQEEALATTIKPLRKEDGQIQWQASAQAIHNLIRGTYPWPGAWTTYQKKRFKIHRSRVAMPQLNSMNPGQIISNEGSLFVVCGEGILELLEVQAESGKRLLTKDCAHNYSIGDYFE